MDFFSEDELWKHVDSARRARVRELVALGISAPSARGQALKEFGIYDRIEIDDRGWMRIDGLDLSDVSLAGDVGRHASPARRRSAAPRSKRASR